MIEVYWVPGYSSCLRMKEFIEGTGLPSVRQLQDWMPRFDVSPADPQTVEEDLDGLPLPSRIMV